MQPLATTSRTLTTRALRPGGFVCSGCLARQDRLRHRPFSHSAPRSRSAPVAPPPAMGISLLKCRRLLSLSGPDASKFLQGVITANVTAGTGPDAGPRTEGFYAAFLTAQGRVLYDVFVYPDTVGIGARGAPVYMETFGAPNTPLADSFLLEVDAAEAERLQRHIRRYKLRAKFETRLLDPEEVGVWHAWNDNLPPERQATIGKQVAEKGRGAIFKDTRVPNMGYRIIMPTLSERHSERVSQLKELLAPMQAPEEAYHIRRYMMGVAEGQEELLREQALPHESNMDVAGAIDFRKGCYVGQELTIRTQHRGVVRKRLLPCMLYGEDQGIPDKLAYRPSVSVRGEESPVGSGGEPGGLTAEMVPTETNIERAGKKSRRVGKWIKGIGNVGLALCRLEIMTDLALPGETAASTYSPDDEFIMHMGLGEDGESISQVVKVKAFVPEWLRQGLDEAAH